MQTRTFYYDLQVNRPYERLFPLCPVEMNLLQHRLGYEYRRTFGSDFQDALWQNVMIWFEYGKHRAAFGKAEVIPMGWNRDRRSAFAAPPEHRYEFATHSVLFALRANMSDDDYMLMLMSAQIIQDKERLPKGYDQFPPPFSDPVWSTYRKIA